MGLGLGRRAKTVLLATGVTNRRPPMDEALHDDALARGLIRYCPICDGYEVTDKKVGVIGSGGRGQRGGVPARLHRRRHADRARQGDGRAEADRRDSRRQAHASTDRPRPCDRRTTASSSTPPKGISPSTAFIRRSAATCTASSPKCRRRLNGQLHRRRFASADQRRRASTPPASRPRARPDQPRDGPRRGGIDHHPQRPRQGNALSPAVEQTRAGARREKPGRGRSSRRRSPQFRRGTESNERRAVQGFCTSRRSPAPKFSTSTTVPTGAPALIEALQAQ